MRYLIVANVEHIETTPFLCAILYGEDGQKIDEIILPFVSYELAILSVKELADTHKAETFEMWTSDRRLYAVSLGTSGILAEIKYHGDTRETRRIIEGNDDIIRDIYEIQPKETKQPPKWKAFLISITKKLLNLLEGIDNEI